MNRRKFSLSAEVYERSFSKHQNDFNFLYKHFCGRNKQATLGLAEIKTFFQQIEREVSAFKNN